MTVKTAPGVPCRVSLADAQVGETVVLVNYEHQGADSPYRACHAVYVRAGVPQARPAAGEVPEVLRRRMISVRAFGTDGMMIDADLVEGWHLAPALARIFTDAEVDSVHLHDAKPGCFAASVTRSA